MNKYRIISIAISALPLLITCPSVTAKNAPAKTMASTKIMTGLDDGVSVEIPKCMRSHVEGFGHNQIVVVQYRLKKEGPIDKSKRKTKNVFYAAKILARDPAMGNSFKCWTKRNGETTHSNIVFTSNWPLGQTGDGFVWLNIPEKVEVTDLVFPETEPIRTTIAKPTP